MKRPAGSTLTRFLDGVQVTAIKQQLRRPKREAPGALHAVHNLFIAYTQLEKQHLELSEKLNRAREALKP